MVSGRNNLVEDVISQVVALTEEVRKLDISSGSKTLAQDKLHDCISWLRRGKAEKVIEKQQKLARERVR